MKRKSKTMVRMLVMAIAVSALLTLPGSPVLAANEVQQQSVVVSRAIQAAPALSEIQYQKFISYLSQEYAPEIKPEWEKVCAERAKIQSEFSAKLKSNQTVAGVNVNAGWCKVAAGDFKITPVALTGQIATDGEFTVSTQVVDSKANGAEPAIAILKAVPAELVTDSKNSSKEEAMVSICMATVPEDEAMIAQFNLQNELDQAIISNQSQAIREVLTKVINNYKQDTEDMKNTLSKE